MRSVFVVRDYKICCEGEQRMGVVAMTLVLRVEVCLLRCLLSGGLRCFVGSDHL